MEEDAGIPCLIKAGNGKFELTREFQVILEQDDIKEKPIVVLSIVGPFRKGKSFFLNFLIRYLKAMESGQMDNWIGEEDEFLIGFKWKQGCDRETEGINVWRKPFQIRIPDGREVVVLLLDTQGMFDGGTENSQETLLFALTSVFSSVMIYNIQGTLSEDMLRHLQFYTEFAKLSTTITSDHGKIFQRLVFLVRDWVGAAKYPFVTGGTDYLHSYLQDSRRSGELVTVKETILQCFDTQGCYLMPSPGEKALEEEPGVTFHGKLSDLRKVFIECMQKVAPLLLSPGQLVLKKVAGSEINATQYLRFLKETLDAVQNFEGPLCQTACQAFQQAMITYVADCALGEYRIHMEKVCQGDKFISKLELQTSHSQYCKEVLTGFERKVKWGGETPKAKLIEQINTVYASLKVALREKKQELLRFNDTVKTEAIDIYRKKRGAMINKHTDRVEPDMIELIHEKCFDAAMKYYDERVQEPDLMPEHRLLLELMLRYELSTLLARNFEKPNRHHSEEELWVYKEMLYTLFKQMEEQKETLERSVNSKKGDDDWVVTIKKGLDIAMPLIGTVTRLALSFII